MKKYYAVLTNAQIENKYGEGPDITDDGGNSCIYNTEEEAIQNWKERLGDEIDTEEACILYEIWFKPIKRSPSTEWTLIRDHLALSE
jgi:hypothetical protein